MSFTIVGSVITQTGTDLNFVDLITVLGAGGFVNANGKRVCNLGVDGYQLIVEGDLLIDGDTDEIHTDSNTAYGLRTNNGGILRVGVRKDFGGKVRYSQGLAIVNGYNGGAGQYDPRGVCFDDGSQFFWNGGVIMSANPMGAIFNKTNVLATINKGTFLCTSPNKSAIFFRNDGLASNVQVFDVTLDHVNPGSGGAIVFSRNGATQLAFSMKAGFIQERNGSTTGALVLKNISFAANAYAFDYQFNGSATLTDSQGSIITNLDVGTGLRMQAASSATGHVAIMQELSPSFVDLAGSPIEGAKIFIPTVDSGNRVNFALSPQMQDNVDYSLTTFDSYEGLSDALGVVPTISILTGRYWTASGTTAITQDIYSNSQTPGTDDFTIYRAAYGYSPSSQTITLKGSGPIELETTKINDFAITELDSTVVSAYPISITYDGTTLTFVGDAGSLRSMTAAQAYDLCSLFVCENLDQYQSLFVSRVEKRLLCGDLDVVFDNVSYGEGVETTGAVSTTNGGDISGASVDDENGVTVTISHNAVGGSFGWLNLDKYNNFVGEYASHVAAQTDNGSPAQGDYYRLGDNSEHGYYNGSAWVTVSGIVLMQDFVLSSTLGGPGLTQNFKIKVEKGTTIRLGLDVFGKFMGLEEFTVTGIETVNVSLDPNIYVDASRIAEALPYVSQFVLLPPDENGLVIVKLPNFPADIALAACALEAARLSSNSISGALTANNPALVEVTNTGQVTLKNDTVQVVPRDAVTAGTPTKIPMVLNLDNYTINPTPTTAANTYVTFEQITKNVVNASTIVNPSLIVDAIKGADDRDLTEVYDNTPAVDLGTMPADVTAVKAKTDLLDFVGGDVKATLDGEAVATDTASRQASKADVSGLSTFDPSADTVARVTLVDTTTTNADMRGTDGANTIAPETSAAIAAAVWSSVSRTITDKAGFALTAGERSSIAVAVWAATTRALTDKAGFSLSASSITSIVNNVWSLASRSMPVAERSAIAAAVRSDLERVGGTLKTIEADTDELQQLGGGTTDLTPVIDAIAALNNVSAAEVRAAFDEEEFKANLTTLQADLTRALQHAKKSDQQTIGLLQ